VATFLQARFASIAEPVCASGGVHELDRGASMTLVSRSVESVPLLSARRIVKKYHGVCVVDDISLDVMEGETVCLIGPSGSGKTTLLRCLNHLEKPDSGVVVLSGTIIGYKLRQGELVELRPHEIAVQRAHIGMVFQHFNLFPHLTVLENIIEAPLRVLRRHRSEVLSEAHSLLAEVGLADRGKAMPNELSGGQQQRVAIARALAMKPRVMLFDEPTSALDPELVGEVLGVIERLTAGGLTSVIVTHEMGFARHVANRVVFMDKGKVVEEGPAAQVLGAPSESRTREFLARVL